MQRREFMRLVLAGAVGTVAVPAVARAQTALDCTTTDEKRMPKRVVADRSCGIMIDVQDSFLAKLQGSERFKTIERARRFARLLGHFNIPVVVTLESPVSQKGSLPREVKERLSPSAATFEKNYFDLTREKPIRDHLRRLNKTQVIIAGGETDVCVLESCLGLLSLGLEVFVVDNLLFSGSRHVGSAMERMKAEGVVFMSYKSLVYALAEAVDTRKLAERSIPKDLPE